MDGILALDAVQEEHANRLVVFCKGGGKENCYQTANRSTPIGLSFKLTNGDRHAHDQDIGVWMRFALADEEVAGFLVDEELGGYNMVNAWYVC